MIQYFIRLFRYDKWANERLIKTMINSDIKDEELEKLMSHIFNMEEMWFDRIDKGKSDRSPNFILPVHQWLDESQLVYEKYRNLLKNSDEIELDRRRSYVNSKGESHSIPLRDILGHVINHSTHHRAQISYHLREMNYEPPPTDYIFYLYQI